MPKAYTAIVRIPNYHHVVNATPTWRMVTTDINVGSFHTRRAAERAARRIADFNANATALVEYRWIGSDGEPIFNVWAIRTEVPPAVPIRYWHGRVEKIEKGKVMN